MRTADTDWHKPRRTRCTSGAHDSGEDEGRSCVVAVLHDSRFAGGELMRQDVASDADAGRRPARFAALSGRSAARTLGRLSSGPCPRPVCRARRTSRPRGCAHGQDPCLRRARGLDHPCAAADRRRPAGPCGGAGALGAGSSRLRARLHGRPPAPQPRCSQLAQGKFDQAAATLAEAGELCEANGIRTPALLPWPSDLARTLAGTDRHDEAPALAATDLRLADACATWTVHAGTRCARSGCCPAEQRDCMR